MNIVFWLNNPPVACKGVFNETVRQWKEECYYIIDNKMQDDRKLLMTDESDFAGAKVIYLAEHENKKAVVTEFVNQHIDDIHIFNGYKSGVAKYIECVRAANKLAKIIVWAERPAYKGTNRYRCLFEKAYLLNHHYYAMKYRNKISALLPLGQAGVKAYLRLGWKENSMFPFMYLPQMEENLPKAKETGRTVKLLYLGRFRKMWKGIGILMDALDQIEGDYQIDFVGGYGEDKEEVMQWIETHPQATYKGTWPIDTACSKMQDYDVCIVPSYYEGWNVTVNETIMAGIGCICTDEAVSNELIENSDSGLVVKAKSSQALADAIQKVVNNPEMVDRWKSNAFEYKNCITAQIIAEYLISIITFLFCESGMEPRAPWIKQRKK